MATYGNPGLIELTTATGQPPVFDNFKKNSSLTIDKTGLILTTTSYNWGTAKATVKVHKGRWYYEVKMTSSGQARIGWATENYAPASTSDGVGSDADSFGWDGSRRTVHHDEKKIKPTDYGENWNRFLIFFLFSQIFSQFFSNFILVVMLSVVCLILIMPLFHIQEMVNHLDQPSKILKQ